MTPSFAPDLGGLASIVTGLADGLQALGCHVEVATQVTKRVPRGETTTTNVTVHRFPNLVGGRRFGYSPHLTWWLWRHQSRFDVLHAFSYHAPVSLMTALTSSRPLVFTPTFHGGGHSPMAAAVHVVYRPISKVTFKRSQVVICGSRAERATLVEEFPHVASRTVVIPFALEEKMLNSATPFDVSEPVILSAGRLDDYKRNDTLIEAMQHMGPAARLVICGDGPDRDRLSKLVTDTGVVDRVDLLGYVSDDDLARWRATASVIASLSTHESFGLSLVEGAMTGAPLVLSDIAPHREVTEMLGVQAEFVAPGASSTEVARALRLSLGFGRSTKTVTLPGWKERAQETLDVYVRAVGDKTS